MKILYVGYGSSIHTARWISQFRDQPWDLHLFPVDSYYLSSALKQVTVHSLFNNNSNTVDDSVKQSAIWPFSRGHNLITSLSSQLMRNPLSSTARLVRLIRQIKPDLLHSFELRGGILAYNAFTMLEDLFPPWVHSSWGSDLLHYGRLDSYRTQALGLMRSCKYFMADCQRELDLAPEYGFQGEILGVFSAGGGYNVSEAQKYRQPGSTADRKVIALKGRHEEDLLGRNYYGLKAIESCKDELSGYKIIAYLPQGEIRGAVDYVRTITRLDITIIPEHAKHEEILSLFGSSKIAIALGLIDGTPHSMIEAMLMGAWPIQSNTADTRGWINDGVNGSVVPPEDHETISNVIKYLLKNPQLFDPASRINLDIITKHKDINVVKPQIIQIYNRIASA